MQYRVKCTMQAVAPAKAIAAIPVRETVPVIVLAVVQETVLAAAMAAAKGAVHAIAHGTLINNRRSLSKQLVLEGYIR